MAKLLDRAKAAAGPIIAGAVGALTILLVHDLAQGSGGALIPWAETNQGLLSVLALAVALAFALIENHRANSASDARLNEFLDAVGELLGTYAANSEHSAKAIRTPLQDGQENWAAIDGWNRERERCKAVIDVLIRNAPAHGPMALKLVEAAEVVGRAVRPMSGGSEGPARMIEEYGGAVATIRKDLLAMKRRA